MTRPDGPPADRFELFGQTLERLRIALERGLRDAIVQVAGDLEQAGESEPSQRDRQSMYAAAAMLRIETRQRVERAGEGLHERAHKCLEYARRAGDEQRALALMEEEDLQAQILASEIARMVREISGPDYATYQERVRGLMPGLWESDELNPLGARTLAAAAVSGFDALGDSGAAVAILRRAMLEHLPPVLALVVEEADRWLRVMGVEPQPWAPNEAARVAAAAPEGPSDATGPGGGEPSPPVSVRRADAGPAGAEGEPRGAPGRAVPSGPSSAEGAEPGAPRSVDATAQSADAARVLGASPLASVPAAPRLDVLPTLQPVVEIERDAVAFAHSVDALPYSREARARFFGKVRSRLGGAGVPAAQLSVVDVVAAMFDYVVDDRRMPEPAKPLIWRLQQPAVALALLDAAYLGDEPRSLRRLVENLGAIVNAFADELSKGSELHRRLETVVRAVEIVAGALQTRSAVMARQVEHEYSRAARNVTQLIERVVQERTTLESAPGRRNRRDYRRRPSRELERQVTERITQLLSERLKAYEVPESVREFVLNVWLRQLRTTALRSGEESAEFRLALQVVDDLLWSLDASRPRQSRRELAQKIPPLIRVLTQGLREIGAKDDEFKAFFDELFLIHLRKMQRRVRGPGGEAGTGGTGRDRGAGPVTGIAPEEASALAPEEPVMVKAPPEPGLPPAPGPAATPASEPAPPAEAAGEAAERKLLSVLASLDLSDLPSQPRVLTMDPQHAVDSLNRGDWLQLVDREGVATYAKVAWINGRRSVVLMVRHPDRRALSMRAEELLERLRRGRAGRLG